MATPLPQQLANIDITRRTHYVDLLNFYTGRQWTTPALRNERRLTLNYAKTIVQKITSYLITNLYISVVPHSHSAEDIALADAAQDALDAIADANNLDALDFDTELDTAILGDGAYRVHWDEASQSIRISAPDVQNIWAWPSAADHTQPVRIVCQYSLPAAAAAAIYRATPANDIATITEDWTADALDIWLDNNLIQSGPNPYRLIPIILFTNVRRPKSLWGESDLEDLMEPARELNRELSILSRIMELSGNPIAVLENVDSSTGIRAEPGATWTLPPDARAYLLDLLAGGGVRLHIDYINALYRTLHDIAEAPRTAFGDNQRNLSGVALEVELQPLMQKIHRKRTIRNAVYRQRAQICLRLLDQFTGTHYADQRLHLDWQTISPRDRSREIADATQEIASGMSSRRAAMRRLGSIDPDAEWKAWLEERQAIAAIDGEPETPPTQATANPQDRAGRPPSAVPVTTP
jgi:hypothetical protein